MSIGFVVGNGTSRTPIDLEKLKQIGTVYACNAVYRSFKPHYLVAVDPKMVLEICNNGFHLENKVYTNYNKRYSEFKKLNYFEPSKGWSSGPTSLWLASQHKHEKIYILGFDYQGINNKINNIFAGTKNYKPPDASATYYGNWLRQTRVVINENSNIQYVRVVHENSFHPPELNNSNYSTVDINDFIRQYNTD